MITELMSLVHWDDSLKIAAVTGRRTGYDA